MCILLEVILFCFPSHINMYCSCVLDEFTLVYLRTYLFITFCTNKRKQVYSQVTMEFELMSPFLSFLIVCLHLAVCLSWAMVIDSLARWKRAIC